MNDLHDIVRRVLENAISNYLSDTRYVREERISVTEALYCLRRAYYARTLFDETNIVHEYSDPDFYLFVGKVVHSKIQEYVKHTAIDVLSNTSLGYRNVLYEVEVGNDILVGHIDLILRTRDIDIPVELKTCKDLPNEPYREHVYQLSTYMVLGKNSFRFDEGYIVYISRAKSGIRTFTVKPQKYRYEYVMKRAERLLDCIRRGIEPEREEDPFCWRCPYRAICEPDDESRKTRRRRRKYGVPTLYQRLSV